MVCSCAGFGCAKCTLTPFSSVADVDDMRTPDAPTRKVASPGEANAASEDPPRDDTDEVGVELLPFELDLPPVDWLLGATTDRFRLDDLLSSPEDIVLGDAADVVSSFVVSENEPKRVHVGVDIATLVEGHVVLAASAVAVDAKNLSPFEHFVLSKIDGVRSNALIALDMKVSEGDLRIALALLIDKRAVVRASSAQTAPRLPTSRLPSLSSLPPPPTVSPLELPESFLTPLPVSAPPGPQPSVVPEAAAVRPALAKSTPSPVAFSPGRLPTGAVLLDGRHRAASLHAQCMREVKNNNLTTARDLAEQAAEAAPDVALHRETLAGWDAFVAAHVVPDDARNEAQAIRAAELGDPTRAIALLRAAVVHNPKNAVVWNRLAVLLATRERDFAGAVDAAAKALELVPDDATYMSNFAKFAAVAEKQGVADKSGRSLWQRLLRT